MEEIKNMCFGAIAGVISRTIVAPMEKLKVMSQVDSSVSKNYFKTINNIYKREGVRGFFSGNGVNCIRILPKASLQYMFYQLMNPYIDNKFICGGLAGLVTTTIIYPLETIRSRMTYQQHNLSGSHKSIIDCGKHIYKTYGISGFYRGLNISIIGSTPLFAINFGIMNYLKTRYGDSPYNTFLFGNISMFFALSVAYPSDLLKRKMQLRGEYNVPMYNNWRECVKDIVRKEGIRGLYAGIKPDYLKMLPANGLFFLIIHLMKNNI